KHATTMSRITLLSSTTRTSGTASRSLGATRQGASEQERRAGDRADAAQHPLGAFPRRRCRRRPLGTRAHGRAAVRPCSEPQLVELPRVAADLGLALAALGRRGLGRGGREPLLGLLEGLQLALEVLVEPGLLHRIGLAARG